jgi:L-arabinose isomerase
MLFQYADRTKEASIDINIKVYRAMRFGQIWGGLSWRSSFEGTQFQGGDGKEAQKLRLFTPVLGINWNKFMFAYTYSFQTGDIQLNSGGLHQITLGYNIFNGKPSYWNQDMRNNGKLRPRY